MLMRLAESRAMLGLVAVASMCAAVPCLAREVLSERERAERELERRRQAEPVLKCTPASLSTTVKEGGTSVLSLTIRNAGGRTLKWKVLSAPEWVRVDPRDGGLGYGEERKLVLVVTSKGLGAGRAEDQIVIVAADAKGSPATVRMAVQVRPAPKPEPAKAPEVEPREVEPPGPERRRRFGLNGTIGQRIVNQSDWWPFDELSVMGITGVQNVKLPLELEFGFIHSTGHRGGTDGTYACDFGATIWETFAGLRKTWNLGSDRVYVACGAACAFLNVDGWWQDGADQLTGSYDDAAVGFYMRCGYYRQHRSGFSIGIDVRMTLEVAPDFFAPGYEWIRLHGDLERPQSSVIIGWRW